MKEHQVSEDSKELRHHHNMVFSEETHTGHNAALVMIMWKQALVRGKEDRTPWVLFIDWTI